MTLAYHDNTTSRYKVFIVMQEFKYQSCILKFMSRKPLYIPMAPLKQPGLPDLSSSLLSCICTSAMIPRPQKYVAVQYPKP